MSVKREKYVLMCFRLKKFWGDEDDLGFRGK